MRAKYLLIAVVFIAAVSAATTPGSSPKFTNAFGYDTQSPAHCVSAPHNFTDCNTVNTGAMCTVHIGTTNALAYQMQFDQFTCSAPLHRLN